MDTALTIAGSDSGGGAGIQADLKAFNAFGLHGVCAVTAVTAQSTVAITAIHAIPAEIVAAQIESVTAELGVAAVKTGMLVNRAIVETVVSSVRTLQLPRLVVDPVMVSTTGTRLLDDDAIDALVNELLPHALCVTPNRAEAQRLSGSQIESDRDRRDAARRILDLGARTVVVTGGHFDTETVVDLFYDGEQFVEIVGPRLGRSTTPGTGCTFSAAIAASLARGDPLINAIRSAKEYVAAGIRRGIEVGSGFGPFGPGR